VRMGTDRFRFRPVSLVGPIRSRGSPVMARKLAVIFCGIGLTLASAGVAITAARQSGVGLKEINYVREPLTSLLRPGDRAPLTPQQAKERLEARGFRDVAVPQRRGRVVVVGATAPRGERVTLVIDLSSGEIAGVRLQGLPEHQRREKSGREKSGSEKSASEKSGGDKSGGEKASEKR